MLEYQTTSVSCTSPNVLFLKSLRTRLNDSARSKTVRVILFMVLWKALRFINNSAREELKQ